MSIYDQLIAKEEKIAVIGLGYVGLPIALEFARKVPVIGFDIKDDRIEMIKNGQDPSNELSPSAFDGCEIEFTSSLEDIRQARFYIITVPTPINEHNEPELGPLLSATNTVGQVLREGDYVVFESTVYPGATEEECVPVLERESGLKYITGFKVGFSPERINPGDHLHTLVSIKKITSGCDEESAQNITKVYELIIHAGRFVNDSMGRYLAKQIVKKLIARDKNPKDIRVLILGATFKENVSDIRNSRVIDVVDELNSFGMKKIDVMDPHASKAEIKEEYDIDLVNGEDGPYDALILAVNHREYMDLPEDHFVAKATDDALFVDVKGVYRNKINKLDYWSL